MKNPLSESSEYSSFSVHPVLPGFLYNADKLFRKSAAEGQTPVMICFELMGVRPFAARYGIEKSNHFISTFTDLLKERFGNRYSTRCGEYTFLCCTLSEGVERIVPGFLEDVKLLSGGDKISVKSGLYNRYREGDDIADVCDRARLVCLKKVLPEGASGIFYFDDRMEEEIRLHDFVLSNIDKAIENGHIKVFYQKQIRLLSSLSCGLEALTRWEDPERGTIHPEDYIPILEENNLTWKIDTFVLRSIANDIKTAKKLGYLPVYVSLNLTYSDFLVIDVPGTIDSIAKDNDIDPSSVLIEITERTIHKDPDRIGNEIDKLNSLGFRVIIDDFGNGYSSINLLNDFRFYAIKIDMEFMKSFNNRSKKLIESIVVMAKKLGIHTISEGVETEEQMRFLRDIGCEVAQGYYFEEPCLLEDLEDKSKGRSRNLEDPEDRELFGKAGLADFITDQAMEILFFDGNRFKLFYANEEVKRVLTHSGFSVNEIIEDVANSDENAVGKLFRKNARNIMRTGRSAKISFTLRGRFFKVDAFLLSENAKGIMIQIYLHESSLRENSDDKITHDSLLRELLPSYNNIYYVDLSENTAMTIRAEFGYELTGNVYNYDSIIDNYVKKGTIFPSDAERFRQVMDGRNLSEKLRLLGRGGLTEIFRMKVSEVYKWVLFKFFAVHGSEGNKVIICTFFVEKEGQADLLEMAKRILGYRGDFSSPSVSLDDSGKNNDSFLWNSLMDMSDVRYFWKDSDRRFLGASRSFLDFYGLEMKDILGRNDEEMGWHPDDTKYRSDEFDVLEKGMVIRNSPGQIYAKGARVNILATKYPLYRNGEIVGLMGYFIDTDTVLTDESEMDHALYVDIDSGLLNSRGLFLTLQGLDDNYRSNGTDYSVSIFEAADYSRILSESGRPAADRFAKDLGNIISCSFGKESVIAKSNSCGFTVCTKGISYEDSEELNRKCIEDIKEKYRIKGADTEVTISCGSAMGNEGASVHDTLSLALSRLSVSKKFNGISLDDVDDELASLPDVKTDFPLAFVVMRPVIDENGVADARFVFVNDKYLEYTGLSRADLIGKGYCECFDSDDKGWLEYSGRAANGETVTGRSYIAALGQWMEFVGTPSSIPGCCDMTFWPVEDLRNERELLTKGHAADNAVIRMAGYLNTSNSFDEAVKRSLAELGRVMNPDRVFLLDPMGAPMNEWCREGVVSRMENASIAPSISYERITYFQVGENYVIDSIELIKNLNPEAYSFLRKIGTDRYIIIPLFDNEGELMGFTGVDNYDRDEVLATRHLLEELTYFISSRMVTDRLMRKLHIMSNRDELTGLLNRHGFRSEMDEYLYEYPDDPFTMVLIDIDDFKIVNDMYGHAAGDEVLKNLAYDLNIIFGDSAIIARSGGDELSVAVKNATAAQAEQYIRELSEMEHSFIFEGNPYRFRLSIGYAEYPAQADDMSLLLTLADSALYAVKTEGKHGYRQYSSEIKVTKRLQLAFNLKNVARNLPGAILVYRAEGDKRILYANDELIKMFECNNLEDFMDYTKGTFDGIVHPDDIETVDGAIWDQINNNSYDGKDYVDYKIRTKSGKIKEVIDVGRFVENDFYGRVFYVIIIDKDERKSSLEED